jgi:hypothetical protein
LQNAHKIGVKPKTTGKELNVKICKRLQKVIAAFFILQYNRQVDSMQKAAGQGFYLKTNSAGCNLIGM